MPAYVVFTREETTDEAQLQQYSEKAAAARPGHDLTPLAFYGKFELLEGDPIEGAVILRFADMALVQQPSLPRGFAASTKWCKVSSFHCPRARRLTQLSAVSIIQALN